MRLFSSPGILIDERALDEIRNRTGEPYTDSVIQGGYYPCEPGTLRDLYKYSATRARLQHDWLNFWAATAKKTKCGRPIDAILCPAQSCLPRPHETLIRSCFSRNWNVLDYPSALIQCGRVDLTKDDVVLPAAKGPADERIQSICQLVQTLEAGFVCAQYLLSGVLDTKEKRKRYDGFPVGLQVVGQRQMEPELMQIAGLVEKIANSVVADSVPNGHAL